MSWPGNLLRKVQGVFETFYETLYANKAGSSIAEMDSLISAIPKENKAKLELTISVLNTDVVYIYHGSTIRKVLT